MRMGMEFERPGRSAAEPQCMMPEACRVVQYSAETEDTFTLALAPPAGRSEFPFKPGQFNMLYAFGVGESAISISGAGDRPGELIHTIRRIRGWRLVVLRPL